MTARKNPARIRRMTARKKAIAALDISTASCWSRQHHYLGTYGGNDFSKRAVSWDLAAFAAQAEMLDEIHEMLRALIAIEGHDQ